MIGVIGDIILDKYTYTSSIRESQECASAPVGVIHKIEYRLGGAGNVALNVQKLGANVKLFGACSDTTTLKLIHTNSIPISLTNTACSIVKNRIFVNDKYYIRVDEEQQIVHNEKELISSISSDIDTLIISDYGKNTITNISSLKNKANIIVDAKRDFEKYRGVRFIKPNLKEYCEYLHIPIAPSTIDRILNNPKTVDILDALDIQSMIITAGPKGAIIVHRDFVELLPTMQVPVADVTGAGDTFIAAFAVAIVEDKTLRDAVHFANRAAAISVTKRGTSYVNRNEI